jgi:hypothetical protein
MDWEVCWITKVGHEGTGNDTYRWIEFENRKTEDEHFSSYLDSGDFSEIKEGDSILILHEYRTIEAARHAGKQVWRQRVEEDF